MDSIDPVALYAAVVATGVAFWDVYKWWRSERVLLWGIATPDMLLFDPDAAFDHDRKYIFLKVQNRGALPCTITAVELFYFENIVSQIRGKMAWAAMVNVSGSFGPRLPYRLERGAEFTSGVLQELELEARSRDGRLFVGIRHSMAAKPFMLRVRLRKTD